VRAATSGNPKFFLGTDSAPHARADKETLCGHAGIYTAHAAIELYAEVFERTGALAKLEAFASFYGADSNRLPRNKGSITCAKRPGRSRRIRSARRRWCRCARENRSMAARLTPALDAPIFAALAPLLRRLPRVGFPARRAQRPGDPVGRERRRRADTVRAAGGLRSIRTHVFETGEVQTRPDNWHDLFNALVWLAFREPRRF